jgi:diacylglycerol kinase family enzyme
MKFAIVLNRSAGAFRNEAAQEIQLDIKRRFEEVGVVASIQLVDPASLPAALTTVAASKPDALIVGGGDGTVSSAASVALQAGTVIGVLPLGTLNHFARDLGMPTDYRDAISSLGQGVVREVDVGEVNDRLFVNNSVLGLYPTLVAARERDQRVLGLGKWPALALAVLKTIGHFSRLSLTVDWGHGPRRVRVPILGVSNNSYDKIDGLFVHRSRLDGGTLGIYVARARTPLQLVRSILAVMSSHWQITPNLVVAEATEVVINGRRRRLLVATDGEVHMLDLPLRYRVRPRALRFLVPSRGGQDGRQTESTS